MPRSDAERYRVIKRHIGERQIAIKAVTTASKAVAYPATRLDGAGVRMQDAGSGLLTSNGS